MRYGLRASLLGFVMGVAAAAAYTQTVNVAQQVVLQGLRSSNGHGSFNAAACAADGSLYLLLDQGDGVRLLKTDPTATTLLAQTQAGATGDSGVAMSVGPDGSVYVTGTTTSGTLHGSQGATFANVADTSTNSFIARYDANLNPLSLTFLGAGRTGAVSVAATADSVFVTGITFNAAFPVTAAGIQQSPATGTSENGFVERFSADLGALSYATYLTGSGGSTLPAAIVADSADDAYIAGKTSASGFPTVAALQSRILLATGTNASGFLTKLNPAGSALVFSTFIAGTGLSGMALDAGTNSLLLTGNVALGQFPVATVAMPLAAPATSVVYRTLLRIPQDGQSVTQSVLLTAATTSMVSPGTSGDAWVSGTIATPLFPGVTPPDYSAGDSFLLHVTASGSVDQTLRFGGVAKNNAGYASLSSTVSAPAVPPQRGSATVTLPGSVSATVSSSLLATQRFELPLVGSPQAVLPNSLRDVLAASCGTSSVCTGSGALLAQVATTSGASIGISADDAPNITIRNLGSTALSGLVVTASGFSVSSDCAATLAPSSECSVALTGSGPGTLTVSAGNAATQTFALPATTLQPDALVLNTEELDFGIVSASATATRSVTVTNLSSTSQTFTSAKDGGASATAYTLAEATSDCAGGSVGVHTLAAGAVCHITLGLSASSDGANDGTVRTAWKIGSRDVLVTGITQAETVSASAAEVDFGTLIGSGLQLPRYLYLSNNSTAAVAHALALLPNSAPFSVSDGCPSVLEPRSVCQLALTYRPASTTATDSAVLTLDASISVLLTGASLPSPTLSGTVTNPSLALSATALSFTTPVNVTAVSGAVQSLTLTNTGASAFALVFSIEGNFMLTSGCPAFLNGGASCTVQLGFAPSQPGARQGLLSVTAGSGFAPSYVALSGTGIAVLPSNNGVLSLGQTLVGEPVIAWYKVQQPLTTLTATVSGADFGVALVPDSGGTHATLPASSFAQSATAACANCWLGVEYLSQSPQTESAVLTLTSVPGGSPYTLSVVATALPVAGLILTPMSSDFGPVAVGSSSGTMEFMLANLLSPAAIATVQQVSVTGDFAVATNTSGGAACGGALAATASCFVEVVFSPTTTGERTGTLSVMTSTGTATVPLAGYGLSSALLAISSDELTFANVPGASATTQTVTLTNIGATSLTVGTIASSDPSFGLATNCGTLAVGAACLITVTFTPQSASVAATLSIPAIETVNGQALSATYTVALAGTYTTQSAGLEIVAREVNYGATTSGVIGGTRVYTLNNLSGKPLNVTLQMPRQFPLAASAPCATVAAGASCNFSVSFNPVTAGAQTGTVFAQAVSTDGLTSAQALAYMLGYGNGAAMLSVTGNTIPFTPVGFGQLTSGQTAQQILTLTNSGSGTLTIRRLSSAPPFLATSSCGATLAAGASCRVTLTYAPVYELATGSATGGTRSDVGSLSIESDAVTSPDFVAMSGLALPVNSGNPASSAVLATYALSNSALTFANTQVGNTSTAQTVTLTNTGTTTVHVLGILTPPDFTATSTCGAMLPVALLPGAMCNLSVTFTPTAASTAALRSGALEIQTDATDALEYISLIGGSSAAPITLGPSSLNFGSVAVGASETLGVTVTNNSAMAVTFTGLSAGGAFSVASGTCPMVGATLAVGATCSFQVTFAPSTAGAQAATASLTTDATQLPLITALSGTGTAGQLQVVPGALAFGSIAVGASSSLTLTLTNTGSSALTGLSGLLGGANAGDFIVTVPCGVTTLAPNQGCSERVTFSPSATGARAATLTVASSDPSGPALVALSGNGVAAAAGFTLTVSGGASATLTVVAGSPATYPLTLTPLNGYIGNVALTCTPVAAGQHAACSLLAPLLTLGGTQTTSATISTVAAAVVHGNGAALAWLLLLPVAWLRRRRLLVLSRWMLVVTLLAACGGLVACGGKSSSETASTTVKTPAGTYQYQVTASSTNGTVIGSTVTLNLIVQ